MSLFQVENLQTACKKKEAALEKKTAMVEKISAELEKYKQMQEMIRSISAGVVWSDARMTGNLNVRDTSFVRLFMFLYH